MVPNHTSMGKRTVSDKHRSRGQAARLPRTQRDRGNHVACLQQEEPCLRICREVLQPQQGRPRRSGEVPAFHLTATATLEPESVIRLTFLFRAAVSRIAFGFIGGAAGYTVKKRKAR